MRKRGGGQGKKGREGKDRGMEGGGKTRGGTNEWMKMKQRRDGEKRRGENICGREEEGREGEREGDNYTPRGRDEEIDG